jgi:hypothetical protein
VLAELYEGFLKNKYCTCCFSRASGVDPDLLNPVSDTDPDPAFQVNPNTDTGF